MDVQPPNLSQFVFAISHAVTPYRENLQLGSKQEFRECNDVNLSRNLPTTRRDSNNTNVSYTLEDEATDVCNN